MPVFGHSSPLEEDIEKATGEALVSENWPLNFEICDKLKATGEKGCKDAVKVMLKRLQNKNPRVVYYTLVLLETCANNCGKQFLLQVSTREFCQEIQSLLNNKSQQPKVRNKILYLVQSWYKKHGSDPQMSLLTELYMKLKSDSSNVFPDTNTLSADAAMSSSLLLADSDATNISSAPTTHSSSSSKSAKSSRATKEEEDLAKAIALSLKESNQTNTTPQTIPTAPSAPYGSFLSQHGSTSGGSVSDAASVGKSTVETVKVRALYDFEAVESNELTFKAGELIILQDDSDENWWKGENHRGTGLFPAHFVTKDLDAAVTDDCASDNEHISKKGSSSVAFHDEVKVIEYQSGGSESDQPVTPQTPVVSAAAAVEINADKIAEVLKFLETADPTGAIPDPPEMLATEAECYAMGPLIDEQLHDLDLEHVKLTELNKKVIDALNMYHKLMEQSPALSLSFQSSSSALPNHSPYGTSAPNGLQHPHTPGSHLGYIGGVGFQPAASGHQVAGYVTPNNMTMSSMNSEGCSISAGSSESLPKSSQSQMSSVNHMKLGDFSSSQSAAAHQQYPTQHPTSGSLPTIAANQSVVYAPPPQQQHYSDHSTNSDMYNHAPPHSQTAVGGYMLGNVYPQQQ